MVQKTKIGGTAYKIVCGNVKVGGTKYIIDHGKTKIAGTGRDIFLGPVPYAYQRVQYIINTEYGNTYERGAVLTLPITTQYGLKLDMEVGIYGTTSSYVRQGEIGGTTSGCFFYFSRNTSTSYDIHAGRGGYGTTLTKTLAKETLYSATVDFGTSSTPVSFTFNGESKSMATLSGMTTGIAMTMFDGTGHAPSGTAGIFGRVIARNASDQIIMDLYPCYRKSDNKVGMWDAVSRTFLVNTNADADADLQAGPLL